MSRVTDFLYKRLDPVKSGKAFRAVYIAAGVVAAISLFTAYWSKHQILHQIVTTVGILVMLCMRCYSESRDKKCRFYEGKEFKRLIGVLFVWLVLLVIWIMFPDLKV